MNQNKIDVGAEEERKRIVTIINYILNKNSSPDHTKGIDYKKAYEEIEELEHYLQH